jgi:hypothetical protein
MKAFHLRVAATLALLIAGASAAPGAMAQIGPAPPAKLVSDQAVALPAAARPPAGPRPMPRPDVDDIAPTTLAGHVARLLPNPNGEVDGLLLDDGTQVAIPPHLSSQLLATLKPGDGVAVTGRRAPDAPVIRATELRNTASGKRVVDEGPDGASQRPREPAALTAMSADGRIAALLHTDRGDLDGVVLDNGTSVRFPPRVGIQFAGLLKTGGTLFAQGYGTSSSQGSAIEATRLGASLDAEQAVFAPPHGPAGDGPAGEHGAALPVLPSPPVADGAPLAPASPESAAPPR